MIKKNTKLKTSTKTKKLKKKEKVKKIDKKIIIIPLIIILILFIVVIIFSFNKNKVITCSKNVNENGISMKSNIVFKMNKSKIENIVVNKTISINKKDDDINYLSAIKEVLKDNFKKQKLDYKIEEKDGKLNITLTYDKKKEYILDNLFIEITDSGVNINVMSEDRENNYATIDLKKEYKNNDIIKILQKADYSCKE